MMTARTQHTASLPGQPWGALSPAPNHRGGNDRTTPFRTGSEGCIAACQRTGGTQAGGIALAQPESTQTTKSAGGSVAITSDLDWGEQIDAVPQDATQSPPPPLENQPAKLGAETTPDLCPAWPRPPPRPRPVPYA